MNNNWIEIDYNPFANENELECLIPLNIMQKEIWSAILIKEKSTSSFNESTLTKLPKNINLSKLKTSIHKAVHTFQAPRSCISPDGSYLCIKSKIDLPLKEYDYPQLDNELDMFFSDLAAIPFDLVNGPLIRYSLVKVNRNEIYLIQTGHHIVCDGWSAAKMLETISDFYNDKFVDHESKELEIFNGNNEVSKENSRSYWQNLFVTPMESIQIPRAQAVSSSNTSASARMVLSITGSDFNRIRHAAQSNQVSLLNYILSSLQITLASYCNQKSLAIGVPFAHQIPLANSDLVGHCTSLLPIILHVDPKKSFRHHLLETKKFLLDANDFRDTSLGDIVKSIQIARYPNRMPLVNVVLNMDPSSRLLFMDQEVKSRGIAKKEDNYEIFMNVVQEKDLLILETNYLKDLYGKDTINAIFSNLKKCLLHGDNADILIKDMGIGQIEDQKESSPLVKKALKSRKLVTASSQFQKHIVKLWQEFLGVESLYEDDDFFLLGGHSLLAAQLIARINLDLKTEFRVNDLFRHSSIQVFLEATHVKPDNQVLEPIQKQKPLHNLSLVQEQMWTTERIFSSSHGTHYLPSAWYIRGVLDIENFKKAFKSFGKKQSLMNVNIIDVQGAPEFQANDEPHDLEFIDLADSLDPLNQAMQIINLEGSHGFTLDKGFLYKAKLFKINENLYIFYFGAHHIIWDGWSFDLLLEQLKLCYEGLDDQNQYYNYENFVSWDRSLDRSADLKYWKSRFSTIPNTIDLPTDFSRPSEFTFQAAHELFHFDSEESHGIDEFCKSHKTTPFMLFMAAFGVVLAKYSRQDDLVIGVPIRRRSKPEFESVVGPFINNLPIRLQIPSESKFEDYLRMVHNQCIQDFDFDNIAIDQLMSALKISRDESRNQLIGAMLSYQEASGRPKTMDAAILDQIFIPNNTVQTDLMLWIKRLDGAYSCGLDYYSAIFEAQTIAHMCLAFKILIRNVLKNSSLNVGQIALSDEHLSKLFFNEDFQLFPYEFEETAKKHPSKAAIRFQGNEISYLELQKRVWAKSRHLSLAGINSGDLVGVFMDRDEELIITLLSILHIGAGYVPLDPNYPTDRLNYMIEQAQLKFIVCDQKSQLQWDGVQILKIQKGDQDTNPWPCQNIDPGSIAYVIFTSGSTGKPKGVMISHGSLANFLKNINLSLQINEDDIVLGLTTISFDISILEIFLTLCKGACLSLANTIESSEGSTLGALIASERISILQATPATWLMLLNADWQGQESLTAISGGEPLTKELASSLLNRVDTLWNAYGPTEATVWASLKKISNDDQMITIGKAIANYELFILDDNLNITPKGMQGTIYIAGPSLAKGYLNRNDLTDERFIYHPLLGCKIYDTGDLGRLDANGELIHLGRKDSQVKVRGFRIELGEIESCIQGHPDIQMSAVTVREEHLGDQRLIAYIKTDNEDLTIRELNQHLGELLPRYMLPNFLVKLDQFPLTGSGKIDRNALPSPKPIKASNLPKEVSLEGHELVIAKIWSELTGKDDVRSDDNFFAIGGHSLGALKFIAIVEQRFSVAIKIRDLMTGTLHNIAQQLEIGETNSSKEKPSIWNKFFGVQK